MAIKLDNNLTNLEKILKSSIYENKMELIQPSQEYGPLQIAYIKGYICSLEETLKEIIEINNTEQKNVYKVYLN
jgi:hypothetical protein